MLKKLYQKLTCMHDWQERYKCNWSNFEGGKWINVTLICSKCGKIKKIKL